jgi:hypothetical protein
MKPETAVVAIEKQNEDKSKRPDSPPGAFYTFFVDDKEFRIDKPTITGGEIMDMAGIPRNVGLILILEDGTQQEVRADEVIELKPGRRFKKAPRFKRG